MDLPIKTNISYADIQVMSIKVSENIQLWNSNLDIINKCMESGMNDIIQKPIGADILQ